MIKIKQLNGKELVINSDLISHIETTGNTIITLTSGNVIIACESIDEIIERILKV